MTPEAQTAARHLLGAAPGERDARAIAAHAAAVCQLFSQHLSRLIGELGVHTLFGRSIALSGATFPCLRNAVPIGTEDPYQALLRCLELESPDSALELAVHVFQVFVLLLERFIGDGLVARLLHEVWPTIFSDALAKETK